MRISVPMSAREVDVLVIGAGAGGMAAALAAAIEGLSVVVCEKSAQVGGTSATSAGTLWIPGNTQGGNDSTAQAARYLEAVVPEAQGRELRAAFLAAGPRAIDFLVANSEVKFVTAGMHPDYREAPGAATAGRAIVPVPFDGRRLGADFKRVRWPIAEFLVLGGMMVGKPDIATLLGAWRSPGNFLRSAGLLARYALDRLRYPRGTRLVMGNALVARLFFSLRQRGVPIVFDTPLLELVRDNGRVVGARFGGEVQQVRARKGVVLATGGLGRNAELRRRLIRAPFTEYSLTCTSNMGEGVAAALRSGAAIAPPARTGGLWTPASATGRKADDAFFPHFIYDRAKPGLIAVDRAGRRFVNEGCSYHDFVEAMFLAGAVPAWLVCDAAFVRRYGLGMIHPGTRNLRAHVERGYLVCADTLDGLAERAAIDGPGLKRSVEQHNGFAKSGRDEAFGKGTTALNRFNGDASYPNPCLGPIAEPPFCALKVWPGDIATSDGLAANEHSQVLDESGQPIAGLYACGNDRASIFNGTYPGPGTTLGPALVFGYLAARHLKQQ
jgi:succinate dehydrogenase/fumarate reductase flavoprotein subunit